MNKDTHISAVTLSLTYYLLHFCPFNFSFETGYHQVVQAECKLTL